MFFLVILFFFCYERGFYVFVRCFFKGGRVFGVVGVLLRRVIVIFGSFVSIGS